MSAAIGEKEREAAIAELLRSGCSCVICNASGLHSFYRRGVADLYELLMTRPAELVGAFVADKVVGKGAAALMVAGGVAQVWTGVISLGALELFGKAGVEVEYGEAVPNIINRAGTGVCPVETICSGVDDPSRCVPLIGAFLEKHSN